MPSLNSKMKYPKNPTFQKHKLTDSPIYEVTVRIIALTKDCSEVYASGTGVVIAQNLILTAKHVFEDFAKRWSLTEKNGELTANSFNIWAMFISNNPNDLYHVYEVANVYINPYSDLVLFHLNDFDKIGNTKNWKQAKLSLTIPHVGERVVAFGFTKSKVEVSKNQDGQADIKLDDEPSVSVGEIIEVYPEKRDPVLLPFPSIRINARLDGGMSGGPVFNDLGELLGIVCSSYEQDQPDEHISYVSLLWPLMGTPLVDKNNLVYPLYDLATKKIVDVQGLDHIILSKTEIEGIFNISYKG